MNNTLMVLEPYRFGETWAFDDGSKNIEVEPFVFGIPEIIDGYTKFLDGVPEDNKKFRLIFSLAPFPSYDDKLIWEKEESGGNWYTAVGLGKSGWLCPCMYNYFPVAPKEIYFKCEPIKVAEKVGV